MQKWADYNPAKPPLGAKPDLANASGLGIVRAFLCNEGTGSPVELMTQIVTNSASSVWPSWVIGRNGVCINNGYCLYSTVFPATAWPVSISGWVNPTSLASTQILGALGAGSTNNVYVGLFGSKWFLANTVGTQNTYAPSAGWQHFAAVFSATAIKLYINGALVATSAVSAAFPTGSTILALGGRVQGGLTWLGSIECLLFHTVALSGDQAQQLYTDPYWWVQQPNYRRWFPNVAGGAVYYVSVGAVQGQSAAVQQSAAKAVAGGQGQSPVVARGIGRVINATDGQLSALLRMFGKTVASSETSTAVSVKAPGRVVSAAEVGSAVSAKQVDRTVPAAAAGSPQQVVSVSRTTPALQASAAAAGRLLGRAVSSVAGQSPTALKVLGRFAAAAEACTAGASRQKRAGRTAVQPAPSTVVQVVLKVASVAASTISTIGRVAGRLLGVGTGQSTVAVKLVDVLQASTQTQVAASQAGTPNTRGALQPSSASAFKTVAREVASGQAQSSAAVKLLARAVVSTQPQTARAVKLFLRLVGPAAALCVSAVTSVNVVPSTLLIFLAAAWMDAYEASGTTDNYGTGGGTA